jgi:hypothetical protein
MAVVAEVGVRQTYPDGRCCSGPGKWPLSS